MPAERRDEQGSSRCGLPLSILRTPPEEPSCGCGVPEEPRSLSLGGFRMGVPGGASMRAVRVWACWSLHSHIPQSSTGGCGVPRRPGGYPGMGFRRGPPCCATSSTSPSSPRGTIDSRISTSSCPPHSSSVTNTSK